MSTRKYQLVCEGACGASKHVDHVYDHSEPVQITVGRGAQEAAVALMYRCVSCGCIRRYGVER